MNESTLQSAVMALVNDLRLQHGLPEEILPEDSLVDRGMTSMSMVDLMLAIESAMDLTIPQDELAPANFYSVVSISDMLFRLQPLLGLQPVEQLACRGVVC